MKYLAISSRNGWGIADTKKDALSIAAKNSVSFRHGEKLPEKPWIIGENTFSIYEINASDDTNIIHLRDKPNWGVFVDDMGYIHHPETISLRKIKADSSELTEFISDIWMDAIDECFYRAEKLLDMAKCKGDRTMRRRAVSKLKDADMWWDQLKELLEDMRENKDTQEVES